MYIKICISRQNTRCIKFFSTFSIKNSKNKYNLYKSMAKNRNKITLSLFKSKLLSLSAAINKLYTGDINM